METFMLDTDAPVSPSFVPGFAHFSVEKYTERELNRVQLQLGHSIGFGARPQSQSGYQHKE
jgi:hypothetical protein